MVAATRVELYDKAMSLSADVEDNFLDLGKTLRQLLDRDPDAFAQVWRKSNLGRRKAYCLVEVSRIYDPLAVARSRLKTIGWTKLQLLGKQIDKGNAQELLELAESSTAKQLEAQMKGEKPIDNTHCVLMYFTPKQYKALEEALVQNGGTRSGRGIVNKEEALLKALKKLKERTELDD